MRGDARHDLSSSLSHPTTSSELCFSQVLGKISSLIDSLGQEPYVHFTKHLHPRPLLIFSEVFGLIGSDHHADLWAPC